MNCESALEETKLKELKSNSLFKLLFPFLSVAFRSTEDARNYCIRMSAKCGPEKFAFVKSPTALVSHALWTMILARIKCDGSDRHALF